MGHTFLAVFLMGNGRRKGAKLESDILPELQMKV
jgi:hypothetical protein